MVVIWTKTMSPILPDWNVPECAWIKPFHHKTRSNDLTVNNTNVTCKECFKCLIDQTDQKFSIVWSPEKKKLSISVFLSRFSVKFIKHSLKKRNNIMQFFYFKTIYITYFLLAIFVSIYLVKICGLYVLKFMGENWQIIYWGYILSKQIL